jgi:DNA-binding NtrC family response regulator
MRRMYAVLERLEGNDHKVLILGETGVGKELVAREVHDNSAVRDGPYVVFDCGAVPERLIESELFGHVRGAFTGANRDHAGVFARAHGGTLFLDEIGELPLGLQPTLLRALETGEVRPVGGAAYQPARPRVVAATNRDLAAEVAAGRFREDLYYRLNVVAVFVPPLRDRREDIPALVGHFLATSGQPDVELPPETLEMLTTGYDWPGNIRELLNVMSRVLVLGNLPDQIREAHESSGPGSETVDPDEELAPFPEAKRRVMAAFERDYLKAQVDRAGGNLSEAARQSGLDRSYFKRLLKRHGLGRADQE